MTGDSPGSFPLSPARTSNDSLWSRAQAFSTQQSPAASSGREAKGQGSICRQSPPPFSAELPGLQKGGAQRARQRGTPPRPWGCLLPRPPEQEHCLEARVSRRLDLGSEAGHQCSLGPDPVQDATPHSRGLRCHTAMRSHGQASREGGAHPHTKWNRISQQNV